MAACEEAVPALAERAAEHDRESTFAFEGLDELKRLGITAAVVPEAQGGGGVRSLHDVAVAVSRLAAGDPSLAIAINMHLSVCWSMGANAIRARARGEDASGVEALLGLLAGGAIALVNATEPGTDPEHPYTEVREVEGGVRLDGTKIFSTLSPAADVLVVGARARYPEGGDDAWRTGFAVVFRDTPGVTINDDWDALGMRGSGSGSIVYDDVRIPGEQWLAGGPWGEPTSGSVAAVLVGNTGLVGAFLGIAEHARDLALAAARRTARRAKGTEHAADPGVRRLVGEIEVALAESRALLARAAVHFDDLVAGGSAEDVPLAQVQEANALLQAAKLVVQRRAIEVVDTAMTVAGGSSYLAGSPLARLYRDVRAGPFMQPFSPVEAYDYIGRVALDEGRAGPGAGSDADE